MVWRDRISRYYSKKDNSFCWFDMDDAKKRFSSVISAFNEIEKQLRPLVYDVEIRQNDSSSFCSASISFDDNSGRPAFFQVKIELNNPYVHFSAMLFDYSDRTYFIKLRDEVDFSEKLILTEFMFFFDHRCEALKIV